MRPMPNHTDSTDSHPDLRASEPGGRSRRSTFQALLLGLALALLFLLKAMPAEGQALDSSIRPVQAAALESIARTIAPGSDLAGQLLREIGFTPPVPEQTWRQFPPVRKIETAYLAAERAAPGGGGRMLALLSRKMAQQYEAVRYEPALRSFLEGSTSRTVAFSHPQVAPARVSLPPTVTAAIDALAKYSEAGALGGTRAVLHHYFELPEARVYEILRTSDNSADALKRGLSEVPEAKREAVLRRTVADVQKSYEGARHLPALNALRPGPDRPGAAPRSPVPPHRGGPRATGGATAPAGPGPRPAPGGSGVTRPVVTRTSGPVQAHRTIMREVHPTPETRQFRQVIRSAAGFGGVVFGNDIAASSDLPSVEWIAWIQEAGEPVGRLAVRFTDGSEGLVPGVLHEDAYAAHAIVFGHAGGEPPLEPGAAVGLAGLIDRGPYVQLVDDERVVQGQLFQIALHPAVADLDLGWSSALADGLPIADQVLLDWAAEGANADEAAALGAWLEDLPGNWKIIDAPLMVTARAGLLAVERQVSQQEQNLVSDELRRQGYLDLQRFGWWEEGARDEDFYPLLPVLTSLSHDFTRINDFARVFALVRWARAEGASFLNAPERPPEIPTPGSLRISDDAIEPATALDQVGMERELVAQYLARLREVAAGDGPVLAEATEELRLTIDEVLTLRTRAYELLEQLVEAETNEEDLSEAPAEVRQRHRELNQQHDQAWEDYLAAPFGSEEETEAQQRMKELDLEMDQLLRIYLPGRETRDTILERLYALDDQLAQIRDRTAGGSVEERLLTIASPSIRERYAALAQQEDRLATELTEILERSLGLWQMDDAEAREAEVRRLDQRFEELTQRMQDTEQKRLAILAGVHPGAQQWLHLRDDLLDHLLE